MKRIKLNGRGAGGSNVQKKSEDVHQKHVVRYHVGRGFKLNLLCEPRIAKPKKETIRKYVDLLSDFGFKAVFGKEVNKDIYIAFLNSIIEGKKIVDFDYIDKEKWGTKEGSKECIYDLYCKTDDGTRIIVEIQRRPQEYFIERTIFYTQHPIQDQVMAGRKDYNFCAVYIVSILEFCLKELAENGVKTHFVLKELVANNKLTDKLNYIYIELPKFTKSLDEIKGDIFGGFCYCLKHLKDLRSRPVQLQQDVFKKLFKAANIAAKNGLNFSDMYTERDRLGQLAYARKEGLEEGLAVGKAEEQKRILELIKQGYTAEQLASMLCEPCVEYEVKRN